MLALRYRRPRRLAQRLRCALPPASSSAFSLSFPCFFSPSSSSSSSSAGARSSKDEIRASLNLPATDFPMRASAATRERLLVGRCTHELYRWQRAHGPASAAVPAASPATGASTPELENERSAPRAASTADRRAGPMPVSAGCAQDGHCCLLLLEPRRQHDPTGTPSRTRNRTRNRSTTRTKTTTRPRPRARAGPMTRTIRRTIVHWRD